MPNLSTLPTLCNYRKTKLRITKLSDLSQVSFAGMLSAAWMVGAFSHIYGRKMVGALIVLL